MYCISRALTYQIKKILKYLNGFYSFIYSEWEKKRVICFFRNYPHIFYFSIDKIFDMFIIHGLPLKSRSGNVITLSQFITFDKNYFGAWVYNCRQANFSNFYNI